MFTFWYLSTIKMWKLYTQVCFQIFWHFSSQALPNNNFVNEKYNFSVIFTPLIQTTINTSSCIRLMHLMCADQVQHREWCSIMRVWLGGSDHMSAFQKAFQVLRGRGLGFSTGQICGHQMLLLDAYLDFLRASSSGSCTAEE